MEVWELMIGDSSTPSELRSRQLWEKAARHEWGTGLDCGADLTTLFKHQRLHIPAGRRSGGIAGGIAFFLGSSHFGSSVRGSRPCKGEKFLCPILQLWSRVSSVRVAGGHCVATAIPGTAPECIAWRDCGFSC